MKNRAVKGRRVSAMLVFDMKLLSMDYSWINIRNPISSFLDMRKYTRGEEGPRTPTRAHSAVQAESEKGLSTHSRSPEQLVLFS